MPAHDPVSSLCARLVACLMLGLGGVASADEPIARPSAPAVVERTPEHNTRLIKRLDDRTEGIWLEGDVLWFVKRSAAGPWSVSGGVTERLTRIEGTDVWASGLRWDRWREAFIGTAFLGAGASPSGAVYRTWRGADAPAPAPQGEPGLIETFELTGPDGDRDRAITVVLPPGDEKAGPLPAIVLADGQSAEVWGRMIAALVLEGRARPVAVVGVHSGGYEGDLSEPYDPSLDVRAREYLDGYDPERFGAHLDWVIEAVLPEVTRRFSLSLRREDLAVAGFSNGGAFAAAVAARRGDVFGAALALSVGVPPEPEAFREDAPMARFYFAAGELEPRFLEHTRVAYERAVAAGIEAVFVPYVAGHDPEMWALAAARFVPLMFPPAGAGPGPGRRD